MSADSAQLPSTADSWMEELLQECARWNILFVHLGAAYPRAREVSAPRMDSVISVADYLEQSELDGTLRLVTDVETLLEPGAPSLGQLRERIISDRDGGARVVLLSRRPKIAFPTVPGSQILREAKQVAPPTHVEDGTGSFGSEATAEGVPLDVVIAEALRELGEVACAAVDAFIFEDGRDEHDFRLVDEHVQEALLGSGLVVRNVDELDWSFGDATALVRSILSDVIAGMRRPHSDFGALSKSCWMVERLVKQALRARAKTLWGDSWGSELLGDELSKTAFERAANSTYASAEAVHELRDPLEWLSLGETLPLVGESSVGNLGVPKRMWSLMSSELLPVKDRLERSQLVRKGDADTAQRWADLLSQRLSMSGSRSHAEALSTAPVAQRDLLKKVHADLEENPALRGDIEKDFMSLVHSTVKFLAHVLESRPSFTAAFSKNDDRPLERELQDSFHGYLAMSDLSGRSAVEVSGIGGGRADVVLYFNDGTRYVTEVKRELKRAGRLELERAYLPQTVSYQAANVPFGQLLVLDLTSGRDAALDRLDQSLWVTHQRDDQDVVISSTVVAVVRGNRPTPSKRRS